jgi:hypothetical protein
MSDRQLIAEGQPAHAAAAGIPHHLLHGGRSRREFLRAVGVGGAGLAVGGTLLAPAPAAAHGDKGGGTARPTPIPAGQPEVAPFRLFLPSPPGEGHEPSVITDFKGDVGLCQVRGTGKDDDDVTWFFDADMRFMQGDYLTVDGSRRFGTFAFI